MLDRTLVVVVADHGEEFHEHGNWRHGNQLYQEMLHVPLLFRWPERLPPGRRPAPVMLIDVRPTILGLLGIAADSGGGDGRNLFASEGLRGRAVFSEFLRAGGAPYRSQMVFKDGLKLIETSDLAKRKSSRELYDLWSDPGEKVNLASRSRFGKTDHVERLARLLAGFEGGGSTVRAPQVEVGRATKERLRALGY